MERKGLNVKKTPNKLTSKTPLEPGSSSIPKKNAPEDDHKSVLKDKSKNINTAAKQRIKRQKTPLEPASLATVNKNLLSEDDKLWDENEPPAYFMLKPLQLPPDYDFHDHNVCIAHNLGLNYNAPIPTCFSKYFDDEAMCLKYKTDQTQEAKKMEKLNNIFFTLMARGPEVDLSEVTGKEQMDVQPIKKGRGRKQ